MAKTILWFLLNLRKLMTKLLSLVDESYNKLQMVPKCIKSSSSVDLEDVKKSRLEITLPNSIEFNDSNRIELTKYLLGLKYPYRYSNLSSLTPHLRGEVMRFLVSLDAYKESEEPMLTCEEIIKGTLTGPKYADMLKKIKHKSLVDTFACRPLTRVWGDKFKDLPTYNIHDVGQIFNYRYLLHWKEDSDDYEYYNKPLNVDKKILNRFRLKLREELSNTDDVEVDPDFLLEGSGSINLMEGKHMLNIASQPKNRQLLSDTIGGVDRVVIQVCPGGCRDTVVCEVPAVNRIRLIDKQVRSLLRRNFEGYFEEDLSSLQDSFKESCKKIFSDTLLFYNKDYKKDGITKPRILLQIMLEELKRKYPSFEAYSKPEFYNDFHIRNLPGYENPIRGHGLGMANSLTSLMQIIIHLMVMEEIDLVNVESADMFFRVLNDDFLAWGDADDIDLYESIDQEISSKLGLILNLDKSFTGPLGIICETYLQFNPLNKKESYQRREALLPFACINIVQAKGLVSSIYWSNPYMEEYLEEIISFWGYEFYPNEHRYPATAGGWYSELIGRVSQDLLKISELGLTKEVSKAIQACAQIPLKIKKYKDDRFFYSLYFKKYDRYFFSLPEEYRKFYNVGKTSDILNSFLRPNNFKNLGETKWHSIFLKRQKLYREARVRSDLADYKEIISKNPTIDFLPLPFMIDYYVDIKSLYKIHLDPYGNLGDPKKNCLKFFNKDSNIEGYPERYSIWFPPRKLNLFDLSKEEIKRFENQIYFIYKPVFSYYENPAIEYYDREVDLSWHNPDDVFAVIKSTNNDYRIPVLKYEWRSKLLDYKKEIFGGLTFLDKIILNRKNGVDILLKHPMLRGLTLQEANEVFTECTPTGFKFLDLFGETVYIQKKSSIEEESSKVDLLEVQERLEKIQSEPIFFDVDNYKVKKIEVKKEEEEEKKPPLKPKISFDNEINSLIENAIDFSEFKKEFKEATKFGFGTIMFNTDKYTRRTQKIFENLMAAHSEVSNALIAHEVNVTEEFIKNCYREYDVEYLYEELVRDTHYISESATAGVADEDFAAAFGND